MLKSEFKIDLNVLFSKLWAIHKLAGEFEKQQSSTIDNELLLKSDSKKLSIYRNYFTAFRHQIKIYNRTIQ